MKSTNADLLKNSAIREGASEKRRGRGGGGGRNLGGFKVVMLLSFISLILIYQQFSFMFSRPTSFITFLIVHILYGQDMTYNSGLEVSRRIAKIIFI